MLYYILHALCILGSQLKDEQMHLASQIANLADNLSSEREKFSRHNCSQWPTVDVAVYHMELSRAKGQLASSERIRAELTKTIQLLRSDLARAERLADDNASSAAASRRQAGELSRDLEDVQRGRRAREDELARLHAENASLREECLRHRSFLATRGANAMSGLSTGGSSRDCRESGITYAGDDHDPALASCQQNDYTNLLGGALPCGEAKEIATETNRADYSVTGSNNCCFSLSGKPHVNDEPTIDASRIGSFSCSILE